jgi:uncharacterized integral membrane protein
VRAFPKQLGVCADAGRGAVAHDQQVETGTQTPPPASPGRALRREPLRQRMQRHRHQVRLYAWSFALIGLVVILVALVVANTRSVTLDWVVGRVRASLIWIILASWIFGWLAGLVTGIVFRHHTRRGE